MKQFLTYTLLLCMFLLEACKDDDYVYPSVVTEFIDAKTDDTGTLSHLISDKGITYRINPREGIDGLTPDSLYRTVSIFQPLEDDSAGEPIVQLYKGQLILAPIPVAPEDFKDGVKTDPVGIQSIWKSGNYINLILEVMVKEKTHTFYFIDDGMTKEDGKDIINIRLYHNSDDDYEAYTRRAYLSLPLQTYLQKLEAGAALRLTINTYKEGNIYREFTY
ncbi:NigD-like C-terminal domain-containing protein [uncultured Bacteroides sp.]|uniref:NigD1/NigD2 family lipoprotein n=1 Tax=uncultured Bacteroides sp. TaxID=162156 RepID=UPI00262F0320|nr:NigD-like C-terminal domain-containing protein [uncultured Bacteroides sp.]